MRKTAFLFLPSVVFLVTIFVRIDSATAAPISAAAPISMGGLLSTAAPLSAGVSVSASVLCEGVPMGDGSLSPDRVPLAKPVPASPATGDTIVYSMLKSGKVFKRAGLSWRNGEHGYGYHYEYNDRGRGPSITALVTLGERGNIVSEDISGVNYMKSPVKEIFQVRNGKAYWKNKFENDSANFNGELYADIDGPDGASELALGMLRQTPGREVKMLPGGSLRYRELSRQRVMAGKGGQAGANGEAGKSSETGNGARTAMGGEEVVLVEFTGSGAPYYKWYTAEGQYFGTLSEWVSFVQQGHEEEVPALLAIQKQFEEKFYRDLATNMTRRVSGLAVRDVTLFDSRAGKAVPHQTVLVNGDKIQQVGKSESLSIPDGYTVIDGAGKFLMPGLWEMHGHFDKSDGPWMLARGVTNLRDMGNGPQLLGVRDQINQDSLLGPNITYISGFIDKAGEMAAPTGVLIHSLDEGIKAIDDYKAKGYDQIKLYSSIEPGWVKPLAAHAHGLGMRVCGHVPAFMTASRVIAEGYDEVTHINMLMLNFFGDTIDTRNITRLRLPGTMGYTVDVDGPAVKAFIRQLQERHIAVDPTMSAFEDIYVDLPGKVAHSYAPVAAWLPPAVKRYTLVGSYMGEDSQISTFARSYANMQRLVKKLYESGIVILCGTDGGIVQHELEIYSESGIPNAAVLQTATWWPAMITGKTKELGNIESGKKANMILVDGNPLENIQDIRKIYLTVKEGKLYDPKDIFKAFGWAYYH